MLAKRGATAKPIDEKESNAKSGAMPDQDKHRRTELRKLPRAPANVGGRTIFVLIPDMVLGRQSTAMLWEFSMLIARCTFAEGEAKS